MTIGVSFLFFSFDPATMRALASLSLLGLLLASTEGSWRLAGCLRHSLLLWLWLLAAQVRGVARSALVGADIF